MSTRRPLHLPDFRTARLGIAVRYDSVVGVLQEDGGEERVAFAPLDANATHHTEAEAASLARAVTSVLEELLPRMRRSSAIVALGPRWIQTRQLRRLPPVRDARELRQLVASNAGTFFLKNGSPLITSAPVIEPEGSCWVAAVERPVLEVIVDACARRGVVVRRCLPAVATIGLATSDESVLWQDGGETLHVAFDAARRLTSVRRLPRRDMEAGSSAPNLDVLGALRARRSSPLDVRVPRKPRQTDSAPLWRLAVAVVSLAAALAGCWLAPVVRGSREARVARAALANAGQLTREAAAMRGELRQLHATLGAISTFSRDRFSATALLGALTTALPDSASLLDLRADSVGVTIVALAPRVASLPAVLSEVSGIEGVTIVGAVTSETVGAEKLERATLAFRWREREQGKRSDDSLRSVAP